ncbi:MAG: hypothetical protein WC785_03395 [Tatlockia sp.]|jgi:hypothetical protein
MICTIQVKAIKEALAERKKGDNPSRYLELFSRYAHQKLSIYSTASPLASLTELSKVNALFILADGLFYLDKKGTPLNKARLIAEQEIIPESVYGKFYRLNKIEKLQPDSLSYLAHKLDKSAFKNVFLESISQFCQSMSDKDPEYWLNAEEMHLFLTSLFSNSIYLFFNHAAGVYRSLNNEIVRLNLQRSDSLNTFNYLIKNELFTFENFNHFNTRYFKSNTVLYAIDFLKTHNLLDKEKFPLYCKKIIENFFQVTKDATFTREYLESLLNYPHARELTKALPQLIGHPEEITFCLINHPCSLLLANLFAHKNTRLLSSDFIRYFLSASQIEPICKILLLITDKTVPFEATIKQLMEREDLDALYTLLENTPGKKRFFYLDCALKFSNASIVFPIKQLEERHSIELFQRLSALSLHAVHFILEKLHLSEQHCSITQQMANYLIENNEENASVLIELLSHSLSAKESRQSQAEKTLALIQKTHLFEKNQVIEWLVSTREQPFFERHKRLLYVDNFAIHLLPAIKRFAPGFQERMALTHLNIFLNHQVSRMPFEKALESTWSYFKKTLYLSHHKWLYQQFNLADFFNHNEAHRLHFESQFKKTMCFEGRSEILFDSLFLSHKNELAFLHTLFNENTHLLIYKTLGTSLASLRQFVDCIQALLKLPFSSDHYYLLSQLHCIQFTEAPVIIEVFSLLYAFLSRAIRQGLFVNLVDFAHFLVNKPVFDHQVVSTLSTQLGQFFAHELAIPLSYFSQEAPVFTLTQFGLLCRAYENHAHHEYMAIFKLLLTRQINHSMGVNEQDAPSNSLIFLHHQLTQRALKDAGIPAEVLGRFKEQRCFSLFGQKNQQLYQIKTSVWQLINALHDVLMDRQGFRKAETLKKRLSHFIQQINKNKVKTTEEKFDFINNSCNLKVLTEHIAPCLSALVLPENNRIQPIVSELLRRLHQLQQLSEEENNQEHPLEWRKTKKYTIAVWDKTLPHTWFLGDDTHCCLSTRGRFFPALIERVIDDAMPFVVATDAHSNQPVALFWLYLAKAKQANRLFLVVNFAEMQNTIAIYKPIEREALLFEMLNFTYRLAKKLKVELLLSPLHYGCLPAWPLPMQKIEIERIGLNKLAGKCNSHFFLNSLNNSFFQCYQPNDDHYLLGRTAIFDAKTIKPPAPGPGFFKRSVSASKLTDALQIRQCAGSATDRLSKGFTV